MSVRRMDAGDKSALGLVGLAGSVAIAGWITHIIVAISALTSAATTNVGVAYGILLAVGCFLPPIGVIHGIGVWFGAW